MLFLKDFLQIVVFLKLGQQIQHLGFHVAAFSKTCRIAVHAVNHSLGSVFLHLHDVGNRFHQICIFTVHVAVGFFDFRQGVLAEVKQRCFVNGTGVDGIR